jgi:hypothetical protein
MFSHSATRENVRRESGWDLPGDIQAHNDHIGADKADLVTRLKRLQNLVDEVKEVHRSLYISVPVLC